MKPPHHLWIFLPIVVLFNPASCGTLSNKQSPQTSELKVETLFDPIPFKQSGRYQLCYELLVSTKASNPLQIKRLTGHEHNGTEIFSYETNDLQKNSITFQSNGATHHNLALQKEDLMIIYVWIDSKTPYSAPSITHKLHFSNSNNSRNDVHEMVTKIKHQEPLLLKPPVKGDRWLMVNAPHNHSAHRRAIFELDGKLFIAQRFAVDMVRTLVALKTYKTDGKNNEDYYCYGESVFAVSDGNIVKVVDGIKENKPGLESRAVNMELATLAGNYVIQQVSKNTYIAYAHFQPGTIQVKEGDTIKAGDILGRIGNSGNSTEPHLHLQVMNGPDFFRSEGIPFGFADITLQSVMERHGKVPYGNNEMPPNLAMVKFGNP